MADFDWRSRQAYALENEADADVAWECLRRSTVYQQSYETIDDPAVSASSEFRDKWGLVFRG